MTSGEKNVTAKNLTGGKPLSPFRTAYACTAVIVVLFQTLTASGTLHSLAPGRAWWEPLVDEYSSGLMVLALYPVIWLAATRFPLSVSWRRFLGAHILADAVFAAGHIAGFLALCIGVYALLGEHYRTGGWPQALYEYERDILAYIVLVLGAWTVIRLKANQAAAQPAPRAPARAPSFDIRDGAKVIRADIVDILAVSAAGNYAQFHLIDGRTPLMRATLASVEQELAAHGFVRTHRSWLVNPRHVRAADPEGSGDFRLALTGGAEAPLSRRFTAARTALQV